MTDKIFVQIEPAGLRFECLPGETVLRAAERQLLQALPIGCRGGGCGVCRIRVLRGGVITGRMSRAHVSEADVANGVTLACRTIPQESLEIEILGRIERVHAGPGYSAPPAHPDPMQ